MTIGDEAILRPAYRLYLTLSFDTAVRDGLLRMTNDMAVCNYLAKGTNRHGSLSTCHGEPVESNRQVDETLALFVFSINRQQP